jgi:hypothetical protein
MILTIAREGPSSYWCCSTDFLLCSIWSPNSASRFQRSLFIGGLIISRGDSSGLERQSSYKHDTHKRTTSTAKAQLTVTMIFRCATALEKALQERKSKGKVADQHTSEREIKDKKEGRLKRAPG